MIRHAARRLLASLLMLSLLTLATFLIFKTIPLDPACLKVNCGQGSTVTAAQLREINHQLGTDQPVLVQYKNFVWRLVRHGSFGVSWVSGQLIDPQIHSAIAASGSIVLGGVALLLLLAIPLGVLSALRPNTLLDRGILFGSIFGIALHPLIVGFLLRRLFAEDLHWLPINGYCPLLHKPTLDPETLGMLIRTRQPVPPVCGGVTDWSTHLILPWITFAAFFLPIYVRIIRTRVLETIHDPHVSTARAKGASDLRVIARHVLRPAMVPVAPMVAMDIGGALMAAIYIEAVFSISGIGSAVLHVLSPDGRGFDLPLVAAIFFVIGAFIVIMTLLADLVQAMLDPRIRTSEATA
jgi:peptide/nickel transport system permease protein